MMTGVSRTHSDAWIETTYRKHRLTAGQNKYPANSSLRMLFAGYLFILAVTFRYDSLDIRNHSLKTSLADFLVSQYKDSFHDKVKSEKEVRWEELRN